MSEKTNELLKKLKEDKELEQKISGMQNPDDVLTFLNGNGFDVTMEDLLATEKVLRKEKELDTDEKTVTVEELSSIAGGIEGEPAFDGHEMGCNLSYHGRDWSVDNDFYCSEYYWCFDSYYGAYDQKGPHRCHGNFKCFGSKSNYYDYCKGADN